MMNQTTLKQVYQKKKLNEISQKVKIADYVLNENNPNYRAKLLVEALEEDDYKKASEVIKKLQGISDNAESAGLKTLSDAVDKCIEEINKATSGIEDKKSSWEKIKSVFSKTKPTENAILKGLAMSSALEKGFNMLPTILKNNIKGIESKTDLKDKPIGELLPDDQKKKIFTTTVIKAFEPGGEFGKIFKKIPFVTDINKIVEELYLTTPSKLAPVLKSVSTGPKADELPAEINDPKAGGGDKKGSGNKDPNAAPSGPAKAANTKQIQGDAKKVGIDNAKSLATLMNKLNIEIGSPNSAVVIPALKNVMAVDRVDEDQAEGYIMGLMSNFDEFKGKIEAAIKKAAEAKAAKEKGGGGPTPPARVEPGTAVPNA